MNTSFYSDEELSGLGLKSFGRNVLISRKASLYSPGRISIGNHVRIDDFCILSGNIRLGSYIHISAHCCLYGAFGIEMQDFSGLSPRCTIFSATDDFGGEYLIGPMVPEEYTHVTGAAVTIGKYVQVGAASVIMPGIQIGEGAAIGAMSLVTISPECWGIYAGIPAKFIRERNRGMILKAAELAKNDAADC